MIQTQSILKVADNSGARTVKCIGLLAGTRPANIGDCIIVSVRSVKSSGGRTSKERLNLNKKSSIRKGQIFKALIIRTKRGLTDRKCGRSLSFQENEVVLINNQDNLIGSRIFGPITRELRTKNYRKVLSRSKGLL